MANLPMNEDCVKVRACTIERRYIDYQFASPNTMMNLHKLSMPVLFISVPHD
jgi:hypothetical protein